MLNLRSNRTLGLPAAAFALAAVVSAPVATRSIAGEAGPMSVYRHADGSRYFALSLTPDVTPQFAAPRDVVILFDTSASQTSMYREAALASLDSLIAGLEPVDQVRIAAVDLSARPMSAAAAAPASSETSNAVARLRRETPLGTTDMIESLGEAVGMFEPAGDAERVVVYIGDGMSNANLMRGRAFKKLVGRLRDAKVSVTSYAIGPDRDTEVLAVLANQTGGNLYIDGPMAWADDRAGVTVERATAENVRRAAGIGGTLARWVRASVVWPESVTVAGAETLHPQQTPPLRTDRDTIVVGRLAEGAEQVTLAGEGVAAGRRVALDYRRAVPMPNDTYAYLAPLVDRADRDRGLTLTTVGTAGLAETGRMLLAEVDGLTGAAERAANLGDAPAAAKIAEAVLRRDPGNLRAQTVQRVVARGDQPAADVTPIAPQPVAAQGPAAQTPADANAKPATGPARDQPSDDLTLLRVAQAPLPPPGMVPGDRVVAEPRTVVGPSLIDQYPPVGEVADGQVLSAVERKNRVFAQKLEREVRNAIEAARDKFSTSPAEAIQDLKLQMQNLQNAPELLADVRASLTERVETALRQATRAAAVKSEIDRQNEETAAAQRELKLLSDRLALKRQREKQLMDRFNALMDERRYVEAEEVASIVREIDTTGVTPIAADFWAVTRRADYLNQVTRIAKAKAVIETLYQVEFAAIPIPDEPPIVYPEASVWEELTNRRKKYKAVDLKSQGEAELRITEALQGPLTGVGLDFVETPLGEVVEFLRDEYNIEIQLDLPALDELAIAEDEPITVNLRNISLRSALRRMLGDLELTYIIKDEVLLITTEERAETELVVKVYPVGDLVIDKTPIAAGGGGGGFGGGGLGGGGGFGGGGGGLGGGGGFGGGGGGLGGGGGGQFSVPVSLNEAEAVAAEKNAANEAPSRQPEPASEPVLTKQATRATSPEASTAATPTAGTKRVAGGVEIDETVPAEQFWAGYFAKDRRNPAEVRRVVRKLMRKRCHDHVIALVESALRAGQPQPWMYEALGIAMQLSGGSPQEVERAVMSAADFSKTPDELMLIAQYLLSLDLDRRAIQLYQQVARLDPTRSDALMLALRAAERANNADGLLWATEAILSRAWPAEQAAIEQTALRIAKATLREMQANGQTEDFNDYRDRLARALERDCLIRVSWTGTADVDLIVEEPGGAVCSSAQPRTAGGGVNLGDTYAVDQEPGVGGFSETYVCSQGFAGDYRARIRRVWGDVTAGRVTVDVYTNFRSPDVKHERQQISLGDEDAVVLFSLDQGRRADPVEDQQLATALARQRAVSRAVLAQQMRNEYDPGATPIRPEDRARRQAQARRGGAVGFQPVIQTLPDGTTYVVNAVASADRRYVIIRPAPQFSSIGDVSTFTFAGAGDNNGNNDDDDDNANNNNDNGGGGNFLFPGGGGGAGG